MLHLWTKINNNKWKSVFIFAIIFIFCTIIPNVTSLPYINNLQTKKNSLCLSNGCVQAAARILQNLNSKIDPCDNFYEFACGGYAKKNFIGFKKNRDYFLEREYDMIADMKEILESNATVLHDVNITVAKEIYHTCENTRIFSSQVRRKKIIKAVKKFNVFSLINNQPKSTSNFTESPEDLKYDWFRIIGKLRDIGYSNNYFMDITVSPNIANHTWNVLEINRPSKIPSKLTNFSKSLLRFVVKKRYGVLNSHILDIEKLYNQLIKGENEDAMSLIKTAELIKFLDKFPLEKYLQEVLPKYVTITPQIFVNFLYIAKFTEIIENTPKAVIEDYILWRVFMETTQYIPKPNVIKEQVYFCTEVVRSVFWDFELGFFKSQLTDHSINYIYSILSNVMSSFEKALKENDWMDKTSKAKAIEKLKFIINFVGYPNLFLNNLIEKLPKVDEVNESTYLKILLATQKAQMETIFDLLKGTAHRNRWQMAVSRPSEINAFYHLITNSLYIPAGVLNGVFFNDDLPEYMNYATIGYFIGHEISHAFDNNSLLFDKYGSFNTIEWSKETKHSYVEKLKCITSKYQNFSVYNNKIDTYSTIAEDFADISGLTEAYEAYTKYSKNHKNENVLPGLSYSPNQMFWLSAANVWCSKSSMSVTLSRVENDVHSLPSIRVLKTFSNIPAFSKDFNCPLGSNMNPKDKCKIW